MKAIMLLNNCFDPDVRVYKEAKYLVDKGIDVESICLDKKNKYLDKPEDIQDGIKIKRFFVRTKKATEFIEKHKIGKLVKPFIYLHWLIKFMRKVKQYLKTQEFSILHCHDITMAFCATIFIKDKKIVFDMHEFYENYKSKIGNKIMHKLVSYTQDKSTWIVYVNDFQIKLIKDKNKKKLIEIPNYPEENFFENSNKTKSEKLRIAYIGVVRDYISLKKLIDCKHGERVEINIYGTGSEYERLRKFAKTINKEEVLKGRYNGIEESKNIYANTDILYAVYDKNNINWKVSMPIKAFEAIITLTPIIATKGTNLGEFVEKNKIGFTISNNSVEELEELIKKLENNKEIVNEKMKTMKKIQYTYTWKSCIKNIDIIYKEGYHVDEKI